MKTLDWINSLPLAPPADPLLQGMMPNLFGMPVYVSPAPFPERRVQFRFPRSKKRRIRRKWAARPENFRTETITAVMLGFDRSVPGSDRSVVLLVDKNR